MEGCKNLQRWMGSRSFRCIVNSTQVVAGTHLTCLVKQSGEDEYTEWKLLGDAAMGIPEVCQCDPGFQLLMTRNELAVCGGVLYISGRRFVCSLVVHGITVASINQIQIVNTF